MPYTGQKNVALHWANSSVSQHAIKRSLQARKCCTAIHHSLACGQARREPQQGQGKHSRRTPNIFTGPLWGENFWIFFQNGTFWRTLNFWPLVGPPKRHGARVAYPPYPTVSMSLPMGLVFCGDPSLAEHTLIHRY